jgi:hypothetical protein
LTTIGRVEQIQDVCRGSPFMAADRRKFVGGRAVIVLAAFFCASVSGSQAAEELRVDAGPCSPGGDLAAQRAQVSKILERLAEKLQFVAVIRDPGCSHQNRLVVDISVLPNSGGDPPVQPISTPDQEGVALYLKAHGLSEEQQGISQ